MVDMKLLGLQDELRVKEARLMGNGFHGGCISAMDISVQRPLIATCSREDSTVRLWNYYTNTCELTYTSSSTEERDMNNRPIVALAMHPSGYYMAVSYVDKIKIFHVLHNELKHFRNIDIKNCQKMRFSNGGHLFAATDQKSCIHVFHSFTLERACSIKVNT